MERSDQVHAVRAQCSTALFYAHQLQMNGSMANTRHKMIADSDQSAFQQPTRLERASALGRLLRGHGWTIATAESCTGGGIAKDLTAIAGSSDYVLGGIVGYSNDAKTRLLDVRQVTIDSVGAVSAECAIEMAYGARQALAADVGVSSTGIAGPGGGTARKPVGLVYLAVAWPEGEAVRELRLSGDRLAIIEQAIAAAVTLTYDLMARDDAAS